MRKVSGFTLIELLIVVAIIAILAAIAVPNFLEAQTRSKVSRAKADMRSMATAVESYAVDNNIYPVASLDWASGRTFVRYGFEWYSCDHTVPLFDVLSSPIAYLTNPRMEDPFRYKNWGQAPQFGNVMGYNYGFMRDGLYWKPMYRWIIQSNGPDTLLNEDWGPVGGGQYDWIQYDSTNGTVSKGNIARYGP